MKGEKKVFLKKGFEMSVPHRVFFIKMGWVQLLKSLSVKLIGETLLHAWHMIAILTHVMNGP